jgi:molecular chaperone GrpE
MTKREKTEVTAEPSAPVAPAGGDAASAPAAPPAGSAEADALKDRLLRLQADFENFRKRTEREWKERSARAAEDLLTELLPVLDHFELGLHNAAERGADAAVRDGFQLVCDQLLNALRKFGLQPVDAASSAFDPHLHEAVSHIPSEEYAADEIIEQVRRGYRLGDKLLRPVQVVVSSGPGAPRDDDPAGPREPAET